VSVTDEFTLTETEGLELVETEFTFSDQHQQIEEIIKESPSVNGIVLETELVPINELSTIPEEFSELLVGDMEESEKRDVLVDEEIAESKEIQIEETEEEVKETEIQIEYSDIQEEKSIETVIKSQKELEKYLDLRKNPIYNLELELNSKQIERETASSEKDFFAWLKQPKGVSEIVEKPLEEDLETDGKIEEEIEEDDIIARFIKKNPQISRPKKEFFNAENMAKKSEVFELDFVTETLAQLYHQQGDISLAIKAYEKLILQNPSKKAYFASLIENLKK
jgi:tetratricopeptide (TPR) repeat protein